jgi:hypothetical protein
MDKKEKPKQPNSFYAYNSLRKKVMKNPNPEEKDWIRLKYEDKMDWINKYGKILEF